MQRRDDPVGDDAGAIPRGRALGHATIEDQLHMVGAAEVEVLAHHLLEQHSALHGAVEDLGQRELRLQNRQLIADVCGAVGGGERMGQSRQPLAQQRVDARRPHLPGDGLHRLGVVAAQNAVVERLESDAALDRLTLQILMPVHTQLRVVGEVGAELHEQRTEVVVDQVDVVVVDHRGARDQPRIGGAGERVVAAFGAHHPGALLRLADVEHAFPTGELAQIPLRALILALAALEADQVYALALRVAFPLVDQAPRHRRHQRRRRHRMATYLTEEVRHAARALQQRHVDVEIQPVDAFELQRRMLAQYLRGAACYLHTQDSGRWAPHWATLRPLSPPCDHQRGSSPQREQRPGSVSPPPPPPPTTTTGCSTCLVGLRRSLASPARAPHLVLDLS